MSNKLKSYARNTAFYTLGIASTLTLHYALLGYNYTHPQRPVEQQVASAQFDDWAIALPAEEAAMIPPPAPVRGK